MPKISEIIRNRFPYEPTKGQQRLFTLFDDLSAKDGPETLLIKGYAGTGKTSIVSLLVNILPLFNLNYLLLAPTGRAAKVLANYSGKKAFTIHKIIYTLQKNSETGSFKFKRQKNYHKNTIFIIDEASMIYDYTSYEQSGLLKDLKDYVFEQGTNKMILLGDTAQLPPVGFDYSGALDKGNLETKYGLQVKDIELNEVVRQERSSGILGNATQIRNNINKNKFDIHFDTKRWKDVFRMTSEKMEDGLRYAYDKSGVENTIVICRSNKQAVMYNQYIRRSLLFYEDDLDTGDYLMAVKNNYYWLDEGSPAGFIANGDFMEVLKISNREERYGLRYADLDLRLVDYPGHPNVRAKAILDTLYSPGPALSNLENHRIYQQVLEGYKDLPQKDLSKALSSDPYLNALQIKFTYTITCHKAQGGQWPIVFLDQGYLNETMRDVSYLRWLYTGVTRATTELYLVNFDPGFFQ